MRRVNRLLVVMLSCFMSITVCAQVSVKELINDYVEAKIKQQDATSALSRMNMVYKNMSAKEQNEFKETIYRTIYEHQKTNHNMESLALIDLYQFFAESNDSNLPILFFIKGEISALEQNDSISLKNSIRDLQMCDLKENPRISEYIATLQNHLQNIRNYVPVIDRLDGIWIPVNTVFSYKDGKMPAISTAAVWKAFSFPNYILYFENQGNKKQIKMLGAYGVCLHNGSLDNDKGIWAQNILDLKKDRLYAEWSSEQLKQISPLLQSLIMKQSSHLSDQLSSSLFDINGDIGGLGADFINMGVSSLVSSLLSPNKRIVIIQCELQMINNYELIAVFNSQIIKIDSSGQNDIEKVTEKVLFTKWRKEDDIFFIGQNDKKFPFYLDEFEKKYIVTFYKKSKTLAKSDKYKKISDLIKDSRTSMCFNMKKYVRGIVTFNNMQIMKMFLLNEKRMINEGLSLFSKYHSNKNHTYLGCEFETVSKYPQISYHGTGVYVAEVEDYSPAFLYGIMKDDILISIDGFEVNSPEEATSYIKSLVPFTTVKLQIIRKGKEKEIPVELSYKIVTE